MEALQELEPLLKIFWYIALPVSAIFVIQTVLTFMGGDSSDGLEADFDGDFQGVEAPFQLFTLRNLINFLLGLSWAGISFYGLIENKNLLIFISILVGIGFVLLFFFIIRQLKKLAEDNTFSIQRILHRTASVYLRIPEKRSGIGKIQISYNGSFKEIDAITDQEQIASGAPVRIVKIESSHLVLVEKV